MSFSARPRASTLALSISFLFLAGLADARQATRKPNAASESVGGRSKTSASKTTQSGIHISRTAAHNDRSRARTASKTQDDAVCFHAPDKPILPSPSSRAAPAANEKADLKWRPAGDDSVAVGVNWGAGNGPAQHGYDTIPMINSVKWTQNGDDNWGGGASDPHKGAGIDFKF